MVASELAVLVTKVRKRLASTVVDSFTLNRVMRMVIIEFKGAFGYEGMARKLFYWGYESGHEFLMRMERDVTRFSLNERSLRFLARMAWYLFAGNDPMVEVRRERAEGGEWMVIRVRDPKNPAALGIEMGHKVSFYEAGAYEGASNTFALLKGGDYRVVARETRCLARGDECCELLVVYLPRGVPFKAVEDRYPEAFAEIPADYSEELFRRFFA